MWVWVFPGNASDQAIIRKVEDDLRGWNLTRVIWVIDRGFGFERNRCCLQRAGGHYVVGEKLRSDSKEAGAALARQGRYRTVEGNLSGPSPTDETHSGVTRRSDREARAEASLDGQLVRERADRPGGLDHRWREDLVDLVRTGERSWDRDVDGGDRALRGSKHGRGDAP